jgi:uncharacterized membrane protein YesL
MRDGKKGGAYAGMVTVIVVIFLVYYALYLFAILINCREICKKDKTTKLIFTVNQLVHVLLLAAVWGGVYSWAYALGGVQLFFLGVANLYVYVLCLMAWPVKVHIQQNQAVEF